MDNPPTSLGTSEIKGTGNSINYMYSMHSLSCFYGNPRVGRFFAVDPLMAKYPWYTPYQFSGNKVIHAVELEGLEEASEEEVRAFYENQPNLLDADELIIRTECIGRHATPISELINNNLIEKYNLIPDDFGEPIGDVHANKSFAFITKILEMIEHQTSNNDNLSILKTYEGLSEQRNIRYEFTGDNAELVWKLNISLFMVEEKYQNDKNNFINSKIDPTVEVGSKEFFIQYYSAAIQYDIQYGPSPQELLGEIYENIKNQEGIKVIKTIDYKPDLHEKEY